MWTFRTRRPRPGLFSTPIRSTSPALVIACALVLATATAGFALQQISISAPSPASGSARVVAQGIVPIRNEEVVWRAVRYEAPPRSSAPIAARPLSFVIASDEPILLSTIDPLTGAISAIPDARLAGGEALLVRAGTQQQRASVTDGSTAYIAMELIRPADSAAIEAGELLFVSAPFMATGTFADLNVDLDLVNAVLRDGDSTVIPDTGQSVAILATDGAIDVIPSGGRRRTLQLGEGDVFTGEIEIRPASSTSGNAKQLISSQVAPSGGATFIAAVVGPEVPPLDIPPPEPVVEVIQQPAPIVVDTPTPLPLPLPTDTPTPEIVPTETPTPPTLVEPTLTPTPELDSDQDGLTDNLEPQYATNPQLRDTDGDWLTDGEEVWTYGTIPTNANTDDDGCTDGYEVTEGFNPFVPDCYIIE